LPLTLALRRPAKTKPVKSPAAERAAKSQNSMEIKMDMKQGVPVRRIFRQLSIRFEDLDHFSELLNDVQTSLSVSLNENFCHLPETTSPKYGEAVRDGILGHLNFLCDRMEGLVEELNSMIDKARGDEGWVAYHDVEFKDDGKKVLQLSNPGPTVRIIK
jgi:hypothetical protein